MSVFITTLCMRVKQFWEVYEKFDTFLIKNIKNCQKYLFIKVPLKPMILKYKLTFSFVWSFNCYNRGNNWHI